MTSLLLSYMVVEAAMGAGDDGGRRGRGRRHGDEWSKFSLRLDLRGPSLASSYELEVRSRHGLRRNVTVHSPDDPNAPLLCYVRAGHTGKRRHRARGSPLAPLLKMIGGESVVPFTDECPAPLELRLVAPAHNLSLALTEEVSLHVHSAHGAAYGLGGIQLAGPLFHELAEGEVDVEGSRTNSLRTTTAAAAAATMAAAAAATTAAAALAAASGFGGGGEGAGIDIESMGEIAALAAAASTAAASSGFVRKHVKPEEYAKDVAKEGARKEQQLGRNKAEGEIRALIERPLAELDVAEAKKAIEAAEEAGVLPSLIDKAVERTQDAAELQIKRMVLE